MDIIFTAAGVACSRSAWFLNLLTSLSLAFPLLKMPTRSVGPITQDWNEVVISKRPPRAAETKDKKLVNQARRIGAAIETSKKYDAGRNKSGTSTLGINAKKLDDETDVASFERVSTDVKMAIQKARIEKKLTQAQLAQQINEKLQVVQEYESGKAIPNQQVLARMERALGVKLRGKLK